jgi:hypothetical protein
MWPGPCRWRLTRRTRPAPHFSNAAASCHEVARSEPRYEEWFEFAWAIAASAAVFGLLVRFARHVPRIGQFTTINVGSRSRSYARAHQEGPVRFSRRRSQVTAVGCGRRAYDGKYLGSYNTSIFRRFRAERSKTSVPSTSHAPLRDGTRVCARSEPNQFLQVLESGGQRKLIRGTRSVMPRSRRKFKIHFRWVNTIRFFLWCSEV